MIRELTAEEICRRLRPVMGDKIDKIYLKYALSQSADERIEMEHALKILYEKNLNTHLLADTVLLEPPQTSVDGEYKLGTVSYADKDYFPFGIREHEWNRHLCISGMSGSGKTNLAFIIAQNFINKHKPFWILDWKKSFRPLLAADKDLMCFTIGNPNVANLFRININRPPKNVDPKEWLNLVCDLITESFFASFGVHKLFSETMDELFRKFNVYKGSENYPTWVQIKDRLEQKALDKKSKHGRESEWLDSALRIAHVLTFGHFSETINHKGAYEMSVEDMLNQKIIFELHTLNNSEKKFFCEFLLAYIYKMKKANHQKSDGEFKNAIIVDEAHNIFLKDRTNFVKESVTDMIYREIREYGTSLICLDQHISKLTDTVVGNSATTIAFQQILPADVMTVSSLMQMKEKSKYFSMIPVGHAIVRLSERHYLPFLVKIPLVTFKENVTDEDIKKRMEERVKNDKRMRIFNASVKTTSLRREVEKLNRIVNTSGVETIGDYSDLPYNDRMRAEIADVRKLDAIKIYFKINSGSYDLLKKLKNKRLQTTELYKKVKDISTRKCNLYRNDLAFMELISIDTEKTDRGIRKLISLTPKGERVLAIIK